MSIKLNGQDNQGRDPNQQRSLWFLWGVAGLLVLLALIFWPRTGTLKQAKADLKDLNHQINVVTESTKQNSPYQSSLNVTDAEKTATDQIKSMIQTLWGGIKSDDDYKAQAPTVKKQFSDKTLYQKILDVNRHKYYLNGKTKNITGYDYYVTSNDNLVVTFDKVTDITKVPVKVYCQITSSADNAQHKYLIQFNWNLKDQKMVGQNGSGSLTEVKAVSRTGTNASSSDD